MPGQVCQRGLNGQAQTVLNFHENSQAPLKSDLMCLL